MEYVGKVKRFTASPFYPAKVVIFLAFDAPYSLGLFFLFIIIMGIKYALYSSIVCDHFVASAPIEVYSLPVPFMRYTNEL